MKYVLNVCSAWQEVKLFSAAQNGHDSQMTEKINTLDKFFTECRRRVEDHKDCLYKIKYE